MTNPHYGEKAYLAVAPVAISSSATTASLEIDTKGYKFAKVIPMMGARTDGTLTPLVKDCATSGGSYSAVSDDFLHGTEAEAALSTAASTTSVGVSLRNRYLKVDLVASAVTTGFTGGILVILSNPLHEPV